MMMKTICTILTLSLVLVACGDKPKSDTTSSDSQKKVETTDTDKKTDTGSQESMKSTDADKKSDEGETTTPEEEPKAEEPKADEPVSYEPSPKPAGWKAPDRIKVQHILIGVKGSRLPKPNLLPEAEARKLAESLCDRVRKGEDMNKLVEEFSGDGAPGIYSMTETGRSNHGALLFMRREMATDFGDVSYKLDVGECAITGYSPTRSPFGFHVIKRLE